jgi:hypothetical protein
MAWSLVKHRYNFTTLPNTVPGFYIFRGTGWYHKNELLRSE